MLSVEYSHAAANKIREVASPAPVAPTVPERRAPRIPEQIEWDAFVTDPERLERVLDRDGVAIVNGVLTDIEIERGHALFWQTMREMCPLLQGDNPATWSNQNWPRNYATGIVQEAGMSGSKFMWFARTRPRVLRVFERLHDTDDLVVSLDTCRVLRGDNSRHRYPLHVDRTPSVKLSHLNMFQGALQFTDTGDTDAGFGVVVGSHRHYDTLIKEPTVVKQTGSEIALPKNWPDARAVVKPRLRRGALVVWNTKTAHGVLPCLRARPYPRSQQYRLTAFVSYAPRKLLSRQEQVARQTAAKTGLPLTHWAYTAQRGRTVDFARARGSYPLRNATPFYVDHKDELDRWL